jgi:pimeloyl-ACP methyl ester carboxylesterase
VSNTTTAGPPQPGHPTATITSADGLELGLWHLGGEGPPLLLAHATGFAGGLWQPVAAHLTGQASCWAVDFRGHGHSPATPDDMVWTRVAEDAIAAIIFPPIEEFDLPPGIDLPDPEDNPLAIGALRRRATFDDRVSARTNFSTKAPLNVFSAAAMEAYLTWGFGPVDAGSDAPDGAITLRCAPEVESRTYVEGSRHSFWHEVPSIEHPVTVALGRVEAFTPSGFAGHIADHIPAPCSNRTPTWATSARCRCPTPSPPRSPPPCCRHDCDAAVIAPMLDLGGFTS